MTRGRQVDILFPQVTMRLLFLNLRQRPFSVLFTQTGQDLYRQYRRRGLLCMRGSPDPTGYRTRVLMEKEWTEVKVMGIMMDPKASNPVVVLVEPSSQKALPIWIGVFEAEAISRGLEDVVMLRPMTHDLMRQILDTLQASLIRVVINDLKGNTFYASLYVSV